MTSGETTISPRRPRLFEELALDCLEAWKPKALRARMDPEGPREHQRWPRARPLLRKERDCVPGNRVSARLLLVFD